MDVFVLTWFEARYHTFDSIIAFLAPSTSIGPYRSGGYQGGLTVEIKEVFSLCNKLRNKPLMTSVAKGDILSQSPWILGALINNASSVEGIPVPQRFANEQNMSRTIILNKLPYSACSKPLRSTQSKSPLKIQGSQL